MISILIGLALVGVGLAILRGLTVGPARGKKHRKVDPNYFKSVEIAFPEETAPSPWTAPPQPRESFEFDFGPDPEEEIKPIGLSGSGLPTEDPLDPVQKPEPRKGFGFVEDDNDDDGGPKQGTLGF